MIAADSMHCPPAGDIKVSICPRPKKYPYYPYDQGRPITMVGYQIIQILSVPTANGYMVVGTNRATGNLPEGTGIAHGTHGQPDAHIDVYGVCDFRNATGTGQYFLHKPLDSAS
jgi:hypothetical protein